MKKIFQNLIILATVFLVSVQVAPAQKRDTTTLSSSTKGYDFYMQRHKTFNTIGWVLLAPGAVMAVAGVATTSSNNFFSTASSTGLFLGGLGSVMMLGSIPCFIISGNNARKAALELKTSNIPGPGGFNYAAISLKISFR
jgi:hypothetical protein